MKKPFTLAGLTLMLFVLLSVGAPTTTRATFWVDELGDCAGGFSEYATWVNENFTDPNTKNGLIFSYYSGTYLPCLSPITVPTQEPDFCAAARDARDICNAQLGGLGLDGWQAYSACIAKSGISLCE